jgi:deoxyribodipyrimidine photo-lyase
LVKTLLEAACALITDDYPAYMTPAHNRALAAKSPVAVFAVDVCGMVPLSLLGPTVGAAAHLRPRWHKLFADGWDHRAHPTPIIGQQATMEAPFTPFDTTTDIPAFVSGLGVDATVPAVPGALGGATEGRRLLTAFVREKLRFYAEERSQPGDPADIPASGLSAHLHFGHLGIQEVCEAVLGKGWNTSKLNLKTRNKDHYFNDDPNTNSYLDEAITWRDLGHHWHWNRNLQPTATGTTSWEQTSRPTFNFETMDFSPRAHGTLETVLPPWALNNHREHANDRREYLYTWEQFEHAQTHDPLWNAAQKELVATGKMHNYLRMLWAKKVLEWSPTADDAYLVLEYLNNKYALDGRDPNSYSGILWCFGLFDRPWAPERPVFGNIRYMSSDNTAKKFKLQGYYDYVARLPGVKAVHSGHTQPTPAGLFDKTR